MRQTLIRIATPDLTGAESLDQIAAFAVAAEAAGFDVLRLRAADSVEALSVASALIASTRRIGLCAAVSTAIGEPYTLARGLAALDHLSGGRAAWEVVAAAPPGLPVYAHRPVVSPQQEADRAVEFVEAVRALWESWGPDALLEDKIEARFSDPQRIRAVNYSGRYIHTRGPLNTPRPPQGRLPVLCDASAPPTVQSTADLILSAANCVEVQAAVTDLERLKGPASLPRTSGALLRARLGLDEATAWA